MPQVLLEVVVAHERDVPGARAGGADRLHVVGGPEPAVVSGICHASDRPVFVELPGLTGAGAGGVVAYAEEVLGCGAAGVAFGLLDADLEVDVAGCRALADALPGVPWTFTRAVDDTLDPRRSWFRLTGTAGEALPALVGVCSAGSPRGLGGEGYVDLLATVEADPAAAALLVAGGGLEAEQVPWLVRAGVRAFRVEEQVRPGGSADPASYARAYVDAGLVRSWRTLLDDALDRI